MKKTVQIIAILLLVFLANIGYSQAKEDGNWIVIAEKAVAFKGDKDVITPNGKEKNVDKIKIKCVQGTLKLKKVRVEMSDGVKKEYDAKAIGVLTNGMTSLAFTLPAGNKSLKKIELEYDSVGMVLVTKKGKVQVMGRKTKN